MTLTSLTKTSVCAAAVMASLALAGCSLDDIQLNGKIFDAMGVNNTGSVKKEAKVAERQPLVVPPGLDQLPEPGSAGAQASAIPGVEDYDAKHQTSQADLEKKQAEYCRINYEEAKQRGDNNADLATGPLGPCRGSVFSAVKKWTGDDDAAEAQ